MPAFERGLPAPELAVLAWIKVDQRTVMSHIRTSDAYHYVEFIDPDDARDAFERIFESDPDEWVRLTDRILVRKPAMRKVIPREYAGSPSIEFTWGFGNVYFGDTMAFLTDAARDCALRAYHAVSFIHETEAHGNIRDRKYRAR